MQYDYNLKCQRETHAFLIISRSNNYLKQPLDMEESCSFQNIFDTISFHDYMAVVEIFQHRCKSSGARKNYAHMYFISDMLGIVLKEYTGKKELRGINAIMVDEESFGPVSTIPIRYGHIYK